MIEKTLESWEQLEKELRELEEKHEQKRRERYISELLYRGQWYPKLETTLDRFFPEKISLKDYFRIAAAAIPRIESFTDVHWDIPSIEQYDAWLAQRDHIFIFEFKAYEYFAYLRHHGFPSPLLDWTASPYIAAFFAFNDAPPEIDYVSVFVFCENWGSGKIGSHDEPYINVLGPYIRTHKRHFLQQSRYTVCSQLSDGVIYYARHQDVLARNSHRQDMLWKFNIPRTEQKRAFKQLGRMNITAFSLFGTEDSLLKTIATTDILLRQDDY